MSKYTDEEYKEFIKSHPKFGFIINPELVISTIFGGVDQDVFLKALQALAIEWTDQGNDYPEYKKENLSTKEKGFFIQMRETARQGIDGRIASSKGGKRSKPFKDVESPSKPFKDVESPSTINKVNQLNKSINSSSGSSLNIIGIRDATEKETTTTTTNTDLIPSLDEVKQYAKKRNSKVKPERFYYYNQTRGWTDKNGQIIKSWKALFKLWEQTERTGENELQDLEF